MYKQSHCPQVSLALLLPSPFPLLYAIAALRRGERTNHRQNRLWLPCQTADGGQQSWTPGAIDAEALGLHNL